MPITKVELESIIHVHLFKGTQIHIHLLEHLLHLQGPYDLRETKGFYWSLCVQTAFPDSNQPISTLPWLNNA